MSKHKHRQQTLREKATAAGTSGKKHDAEPVGHWITTDSGKHIFIEEGKGTLREQVAAHFAKKGQSDHTDIKGKVRERLKMPAKPKATRGVMAEAKREGTGKNSRVVLADGSEAPPHIKASMIPPAWKNVKVGTNPDVDVLATGEIVNPRSGKIQLKTVYRESFHTRNAEIKFARVAEIVRKHDAITQEIHSARATNQLKEEADCAWLMSVQATRPGSDKDLGARVKAYGATTLREEHVVESPQGVRLQFVGKEGIHHDHLIRDEKLGKMLLDRKATAKDRNGRIFATDDKKVRKFTRSLDGGKFTPKDFRTSAATRLATDEVVANPAPSANLKEHKKRVMEVATKVSKLLGNRPAQALKSYIHPGVFDQWRPR